MTNYITLKKVTNNSEDLTIDNPLIVELISFYDLPSAKKHYEKTKDSKKNVPYVFSNQRVITELIVFDLGITKLNQKENKEYEKKEVLEKHEFIWNDEIQKQKN